MRLKRLFNTIQSKRLLLTLALTTICSVSFSAPKLVVQIIVSQMRYDYLERFGSNFSSDGFKSFYSQGMVFDNARYNYMITSTQAGLATISTGANPSVHGITGDYWINLTSGNKEYTVIDNSVTGVGCDLGLGNYSAANLNISTLGDKLIQSDSLSRVFSIAIDPASAVISGSDNAQTYWLDRGRGRWISSTAYFPELKDWVVNYNSKDYSSLYSEIDWSLCNPISTYKNKKSYIIERNKRGSTHFSFDKFKERFNEAFGDNVKQTELSKPLSRWVNFSKKLYTPVGNKIVCDFANRIILEEGLGKNHHTDLLTVCFDSPRYVSELFGPESIELEDCYYQLDRDLSLLLQSIFAQFSSKDVLVVLSSDHGSSSSINSNEGNERLFDKGGYMMIMNAFLSAQYGSGDWILDYHNRQLYLNRNLIYNKGLDLEQIQNKVAAFSLQYRGISHAITSTALQNGYFGDSGYAASMYNSFYPRRAGDLTINLMPGWIEDKQGICSSSGSSYEYDTHVPLMLRGGKIEQGTVVSKQVDMSSIAPTLARIMEIEIPDASHGWLIEEITHLYR